MKPHRVRILVAAATAAVLLAGPVPVRAAHSTFPSGSPFTSGTDTFTGFTSCVSTGGAGPTGLIDDGTSFFVVSVCDQVTYRFAASGGSVSTAPASSKNGFTHGLALQQSHYYGVSVGGGFSSLATGVYEFDPTTLAVTRTVATTSSSAPPLDVVADPQSGDLYVTRGTGGIWRIQNPAGSSPTITTFYSTTDELDGAVFKVDGSVLYVADPTNGHVLGIDRTAKVVLDVVIGAFPSSHGPDGIAVASPNQFTNINGSPVDVSNDLFVNSNDGTIEMIDVHNSNAVSVVASGGTRGDFATVGPDHCLYVTQANTVEKLTPCFFEPTPDPPISASGVPGSGIEGASFSGAVATFRDPDTVAMPSEYSATINWGDGSPVDARTPVITGGSGSFSVSGSHTYLEEGVHNVTATLTDVDNSKNPANSITAVTVIDAALSVTSLRFGIAGPHAGAGGTFKDSDPGGLARDYSLLISWGDGSSSRALVFSLNGGFAFIFLAIHTYMLPGTYTVTVTARDAGGATSTTTSSIEIK